MKNEFYIRRYTEDDLEQISKILKVIGWADQYVVGQLECIKKLCISNAGEVFVATHEEVVVGFIQVEHHQWNRLSYLHGLVVHPDFRRLGIAKKLVERVEISSRNRKQRGVSVDTPVDNLGGRKFYTSIGFNEAYIMPEFYEAGLDGVTFQKIFHPKSIIINAKTNIDGIFESSEKDIHWVNEQLTKFNNQQAPFTQSKVDIFFNYHVKASNGDIIAGINSIMYAWGIVFIGILFVDEAHRAKGLGIKLLKHVENEAKKNGGYLALLDTFDFQAKDFYIKAGYEVFGTVHDCPPGHTRHHMLKRLNSPEVKPFAPLAIETERLRLVAATKDLSTAAITDIALFSKLLNARITDEWPPELLSDAQDYFSEMLTQNPSSTGWWIWYVILKAGCDVLIGNLCFKGPPSDQGKVEIGYAILPEFEKNGFATEAVRALISWAFSNQQVTSISAETFPNLPVSIKVMEKIGMSFAGNGSEEGTIRYEIRKKKL